MDSEHALRFVAVIVLLATTSGIILSIVYWSWRNGISPMPTTPKAKRCLLKALPKGVSGNIYELGSGWGTLAFALARLYPQCRVIGYETSPIPYFFSRLRQRFCHLSNLELRREDFFSANLSDAGLVVCYLFPGAMQRLQPKLAAELKCGAWVASNTFALPGMSADAVIEIGDIYRTKIYLYSL